MSQTLQDDYDALNDFAHDLKNPLGVIKNCLELVGVMGETNDRQTQFIERGMAAAERIERMVANLLEYARLGTDYQPTMEPVDLVNILQEVFFAAEHLAKTQGIQLTSGIAADLPTINGNDTLLHSLFLNLLTNAIKYNKPEEGTAHLAAHADDAAIIVQVIDTGIGISEEDQARIFNRFFRVENKQRKTIEGAGLGLSIVDRIVEAHNAAITIESQLKVGTTFTIRLPITSASDESS